jgi:phosphatidylglycerol lysyltransferase
VADDVGTDQARVLALLKRHGWNATSFQVLEPGFRYWFDGDDACVGYVDTGSAWVAAGPPISAPERCAEVTARFVAAAKAARRRASCFGTEDRFHDITGWPALRVGDQPAWRPETWTAALAGSSSLREQLRRSRAKGVKARLATPAELAPGEPLRVQIDALIRRWLDSRVIAPMGFLVQVQPFTFPDERRYFVAEQNGAVVGFLGVVPIYARRGWFFEDFLRDPAAPNGTVELLVDAGMRAAGAEGIDYVTLGLVPLAGEVGPWLRAARRAGNALYDFEGLRAFKAKLKPERWDPIFLAYPPSGSGIAAIFDTLRAFARGGLLRFGVQTLLRGPAVVMRVLAALLVVWTAALALPISARWFPSRAWQYGWVGFDAIVAVALFVLSTRWRRGLANVLASIITLDAIVTLVQILAFDAPVERGWLDVVVMAAAVAAPTGAAIMLWNARARRAA